jgi:hypothetical protein
MARSNERPVWLAISVLTLTTIYPVPARRHGAAFGCSRGGSARSVLAILGRQRRPTSVPSAGACFPRARGPLLHVPTRLEAGGRKRLLKERHQVASWRSARCHFRQSHRETRAGTASNTKIAGTQFLRILAGFSLHFRCIVYHALVCRTRIT